MKQIISKGFTKDENILRYNRTCGVCVCVYIQCTRNKQVWKDFISETGLKYFDKMESIHTPVPYIEKAIQL